MRRGRRVFLLAILLGVAMLLSIVALAEEADSPATWELTQYSDASGNQGMFYSLVNQKDGTLILIDGGWKKNAKRVRRVIDKHGGRVTAWFLTHYHGDHIGAFNELWNDYRDNIGTVYVNPLDWETFEPIAKDWDTPDAFSRFLEQTADADNVVKLYRDDTLEIDGIQIRVFNAFDDHVRELSTDWPNDCSLVMKFSFSKDTVLFLGDLARGGIPLGQYLLDTYGADALHADYVQAGHHGNWGLPISFYEAIHPGILFQDSPKKIMTGEKYDAKELRAWCQENGIQTYDYRQAPSSFILK